MKPSEIVEKAERKIGQVGSKAAEIAKAEIEASKPAAKGILAKAKKALGVAAVILSIAAVMPAIPAHAQDTRPIVKIKTRLDHFSGTNWILVISYLPSEITSITCEKWTMLGINSWKNHNEFTIPTGPAVAVMDTSGFDGYCKGAGSIIAHTDDGDAVGVLDRGAGNWTDSTKLTFTAK